MLAPLQVGGHGVVVVEVHVGQVDARAGDHRQRPLRGVGDARERVDRRDLDRQLDAADAGELGGQHQQVGRIGQRRQRPGEHEREREPGRRRLVEVVELHHLVLEPEHRPRIDVERQVQVDRAAARLLRVQVDLPQLAQRVGLDEVPLVVDVEAVIDRLALQHRRRSRRRQ